MLSTSAREGVVVMARKKHIRLPNGFGTIATLSGNRTNKYAVYPPAKLTDDLSEYKRPKAICYVDDWYVAFAVLNAYHAGTYKLGDELTFKQSKTLDKRSLDQFCLRILADYQQHSRSNSLVSAEQMLPTFAEVYQRFWDWKFGENAARKLSEASRTAVSVAYKHCKELHEEIFAHITHDALQSQINGAETKSATKELIKSLFVQMYRYALLYDLCEKDVSMGLIVPNTDDDEKGVPFSTRDLRVFWKNKDDPVVEFLLIMCYSGFRIKAYQTMEVDLTKWSLTGGVKNKYSKRTNPIHPAIRPLIERRLARDGCLIKGTLTTFRNHMRSTLERLGIDKHTPHDCRHTFSMLCERYGVPENDRKRMLGHSIGDVTNDVYGHRTLADLQRSINRIRIPRNLSTACQQRIQFLSYSFDKK